MSVLLVLVVLFQHFSQNDWHTSADTLTHKHKFNQIIMFWMFVLYINIAPDTWTLHCHTIILSHHLHKHTPQCYSFSTLGPECPSIHAQCLHTTSHTHTGTWLDSSWFVLTDYNTTEVGENGSKLMSSICSQAHQPTFSWSLTLYGYPHWVFRVDRALNTKYRAQNVSGNILLDFDTIGLVCELAHVCTCFHVHFKTLQSCSLKVALI